MSFPRYREYKDSGVAWVGIVPQHWGIGQSRRLFALRKDRAFESDEQLTASQKYGVILQREFMEREGQKVVQVILDSDILKHAEPGDFVISMRSFQGGIEWCNVRGCVSSAYVVLIPNDQIWGRYFAYLFKSHTYIQALQSTTNLVRDGQALRYDNFTQVGLPLVPLSEQVLIASFLDRETAKIDGLVSEQRRLIELLTEKRQAVISHAVTKGLNPHAPMKPSGIDWLGDVPEHWEVGRVKFASRKISKGDTPSNFGMDFVVDGPVRFIKIENIGEGELIELPRYAIDFDAHAQLARSQLLANDIVFAIAGATTGKCAIVREEHLPANTNQAVAFIRPNDRIVPSFLVAWLQNPELKKAMWEMAVQSAQPNLSMENLGNLPVLLPPKEEQAAILRRVEPLAERYLDLITESLRAIELMQERRTALISAAVTGKIDVRGLVETEAA